MEMRSSDVAEQDYIMLNGKSQIGGLIWMKLLEKLKKLNSS